MPNSVVQKLLAETLAGYGTVMPFTELVPFAQESFRAVSCGGCLTASCPTRPISPLQR